MHCLFLGAWLITVQSLDQNEQACSLGPNEDCGQVLLQLKSKQFQKVPSQMLHDGQEDHQDYTSYSHGSILPSIRPFLEQKLLGKQFTYIVNTGNAGDALIQHGTMLLFDDIGLTYDFAPPDKTHTNKTLVYAGAGNLIEVYQDCSNFLKKNAPIELRNTIILLPATIRGEAVLLKSLGPHVTIFTRERMSYEHVTAEVSNVSVFLTNDMAFYIEELDPEMDLLKAQARTALSTKSIGYMLRTDSEGFGAKLLPSGNEDVSTEGGVSFTSSKDDFKDNLRKTAHKVMRKVGDYSQVWTNRLHLCIASAMVGVEAHCMDNNYGKVKAVFEMSLQGRYPNAHWDGSVSDMPWTSDLRLINCCIAGVVLMVATRVLQRLFGEDRFGILVLLADIVAWYVTSSVYLAASQELIKLTDGPSIIIIPAVQVLAGSVILPFGQAFSEGQSLKTLSWHYLIILASVGCAQYFGSFFQFESLAHGGLMLVQNVRALEPFSTTCLMVLFAGESITCLQYLGIILAVVGVVIANYHPFNSDQHSDSFLAVAVLLAANLLYSLKSVLLSEASKFGFNFKPQVTIFAVCCAMALLPSAFLFTLYRLFYPNPVTISSLFPNSLLLLTSSLSFVVYNLASFLVLMQVKPTSHAMLLTGKRVVTTLLACVLANQLPRLVETAGLIIVVMGLLFFEAEKRRQLATVSVPKLQAPSKTDRITTDTQLQESSKADAITTNTQAQTMIMQLLVSHSNLAIFISMMLATCVGLSLFLSVQHMQPQGPTFS